MFNSELVTNNKHVRSDVFALYLPGANSCIDFFINFFEDWIGLCCIVKDISSVGKTAVIIRDKQKSLEIPYLRSFQFTSQTD